jgi:two-component system OmpR family sensor kinase
MQRLDSQLISAGDRYAASLRHGEESSPEEDHDSDDIPGQAEGTLGVRIVDGRIEQATVVTPSGQVSAVALDAEAIARLSSVPLNESSNVDLGTALGDYRVRAVHDADGDVELSGLPLEPVNETLTELFVVEAILFLGVVALGGLVTALVVRRTLRPLRQLADDALGVSELVLNEPDALPRFASAERSGTEVDQVSDAFDRMLGGVREALTIRDDTEARLRRFVADASHELRTPVATISAYAEYARTPESGDLPPETVEALTRISVAAHRMARLVADLLVLARMDEHRPLERHEIDLTMLVLEAVTDARAAGPDHHWKLDLPEAPVEVVADGERLHQVLTNLLNNARIHTPPGTTVTVGLRSSADEARLWVADDGPGIPVELRDELFDRFSRGDPSRSRMHGGTGLGLAIARALVEAHGGHLTVSSELESGARFDIVLPRT